MGIMIGILITRLLHEEVYSSGVYIIISSMPPQVTPKILNRPVVVFIPKLAVDQKFTRENDHHTHNIGGYQFGGPYSKDYSRLGSYLWKLPYEERHMGDCQNHGPFLGPLN